MKKYEKARFGHEQIGISDDLAVKNRKIVDLAWFNQPEGRFYLQIYIYI